MTFQEKLDGVELDTDELGATDLLGNYPETKAQILSLIESDVIGEYEQFKSIPGSFRTDIRNKLRSEQRSIIREETKDE